MSLFNQIQWQLIEKPKQTYNYLIVRRKKEETEEEKEKREKAEWKELCKQKKEELWEEEFKKWRAKARYQKNRKKHIDKQLSWYYRNKAEEESLFEEIYSDVYDKLPSPIDYNKVYADKYDEDDRWGDWWYKFYWRASRLNRVHANQCQKITRPVRVYNRWNFGMLLSKLWTMQDRAYEYIKPHLWEICIKDMFLAQEQFFTKLPMRITKNKMRQLTEETDISKNQICTVASALLRDKYIVSELYLWRVSFLMGDIIITHNWNVMRPILENNIPWLNKDTVEELHKKRFDWLHRKIADLPIYILWDSYLIRIQINKRETFYYIVPT